nr:HAMP domain-containing sensor histidine kinase [Tissierella pigra]
MLSKLQSQVIKLSDILKSHNIRQRKEKDDLASLISDISHQLKTPLANLNIYNSLLLDTSLSDDRRIEFTKNMQSQIEKLNWLMESLIKMSKLETGIIKLNIKNQSITQTVLQAILMVSPKAEQKGINITFSSEKDIICNHDTKWTQEAIFNILDNGIKYSPDNTEIHMSIIKYELFCRIDIQDKGDGIIESDINKIFTRFYRGENSKNIDGVGIGLFLSRKIVSQQGGYIKVKSILGRGSVFSVFLPFET